MITREHFPESVRPSFDEMARLFSKTESRADDLFMETATWNFWARNRTNKELSDAIMWVRITVVREGHNHLAAQLHEVIRRLRKNPTHRRLFQEERKSSQNLKRKLHGRIG